MSWERRWRRGSHAAQLPLLLVLSLKSLGFHWRVAEEWGAGERALNSNGLGGRITVTGNPLTSQTASNCNSEKITNIKPVQNQYKILKLI